MDEGTLVYWNDEKLFGFIRPDGNGNDIYLHVSKLPPDALPRRGDRIRYSTIPGREPGRLAANKAELA